MRLILAIQCFFLVLFAKRLPNGALALLPAKPEEPKPEPPKPEVKIGERSEALRGGSAAEDARSIDGSRGAVQLLAILQREGRLLDFLQEEIDGYSDDQIGAAVRDIHRGCKKALAEHAPLSPVLPGEENASVRVDAGFDPSRIRLVG